MRHYVTAVLGAFGVVKDSDVPDAAKAHCLVTMEDECAAREAQAALHAKPCAALGGRMLWVQFSEVGRCKLPRPLLERI